MEMDLSEDFSDDTFRKVVTTGPVRSTVAKLSGSSRGIPTNKDFHFYNNFNEFRTPISEIDKKSKELLEKIGGLSHLWGKSKPSPEDLDECGEWLVDINDDVLEKLSSSLDEFMLLREKNEKVEENAGKSTGEEKGAKVAMKAKPKVPFHIASIRRPQDEYKIIVNNSNKPFEHVWLEKSGDGSGFVHPLEKLDPSNFVESNVDDPVKPAPLEATPFKFVDEVKYLKQLADKLRAVDEFAVDLEHNQYRSFQGLTCLMQISTRTEDFVVDTLKLRVHVGPYLRDVFRDNKKKKVMHGADRDIVWLQRDFGIYVCNMFDTGQASRVLKLERNSLEYLLQHFCGVTANKEYQNADWRLRPLPEEMMRYAREDTHYLLYIYDVMRMELLSLSADGGSPDDALREVYKRSYDICMQLYKKELLTDDSYLHIHGLQEAGFNAQQLAVVAGLCRWRDGIARAEDESTGYILPNKTLIDIAKQMPLTTIKLKQTMKSKLPYVERNLSSVVSIIRHSVQNSAAYAAGVEQLAAMVQQRERRLELAAEEKALATECADMLVEISEPLKAASGTESSNVCTSRDASAFKRKHTVASIQQQSGSLKPDNAVTKFGLSGPGDTNEHYSECGLKATTGQVEVTIQAIKKPNRGVGMLLGSTAKSKLHRDKKEQEEIQVQQIKSSVSLPFHAFSGSVQLDATEPAKPLEINHTGKPVATDSKLDIITLDTDSDDRESLKGDASSGQQENPLSMPVGTTSKLEDVILLENDSDLEDENMSLSEKPQAHEGQLTVQPFDYEVARKEVVFGEDPGKRVAETDSGEHRRNKADKAADKKKSLLLGQPPKIDETAEFQQGRRRQAFPASGNRSYTFR